MIKVGEFNTLRVIRTVDFGVFLDDGKEGILLPKRFVPAGLKVGDELEVFVYHDSEDRLIATTQKPLGTVGDIVALKAVSATKLGAFLDWGLMKDLFVPKSKQLGTMRVGGIYIVRIYIDEQTGRVAATEKIENFLSNEDLDLKEKDAVDLLVYRRTDIGYLCIINGKHTGVLHFSDIYQNIQVGDRLKGYVRKIREENKIDLALGERGYQRVSGEAGKILELLDQHGGFLPYHDKSDPEDIYDNLGMSKKAFKMAIGNLFKQKLIRIKENGIEKI
ncbi:S1-like domain-containing RNA-binding protein [Flavihumibacter sp. RY-1]|uniref:S1-like domain-containing RNA-binding protein n=1 Tax=Flavihumibacter fluminis TaxID=2909236 RepID=A0ABS9BKV2_9BACT|nr:S1-like domain-containing RNA-binding protein [Flavihumibacter fluminis]MCF1715864.1 S1-like domain-containing RNA-binding protein [Flavihumibacter fluminis]